MSTVARTFSGRLALQQRVLPAYRAPLFDTLAQACQGGLSVFAGQPQPAENIRTTDRLAQARFFPAKNYHFQQVSSPFYLCWQTGLLRWLTAWDPDALIVEANPRYWSTPQAVRWMHARNRPVLGWGLGVPQGRGRFAFLRAWNRVGFLRTLDGVIAYSHRGAEEYCSIGFPAERVFVAPNAAAPAPVHPLPDRPDSFLDSPLVLFVGRLQSRKRLDNLFAACAALPPERQPRLWIVGDGPARQEFQALAQQLYPAAEFLGARHGKDLEACFRAADVFVLPGTGGLAVQEAMSFGLPVIVAEGDGTQEDLVRPENGWQVRPGDLDSLTQALDEALSSPGRLRKMGASSYRIVKEEVNLESMAAVFLKAVSSVYPV